MVPISRESSKISIMSPDLIAQHFGRDPVAMSQGVGKLEWRLLEERNLRKRMTQLTENFRKGKRRIRISLCLTPGFLYRAK